ncbi:MAG: Argininosuccinate lyase, partial [Myxococcaceae bacterium]|nr:Argininosuccinate lyase [Myxococcaceae bacterium]
LADVADVLAVHHEDHHLREVRRVVGDAFDADVLAVLDPRVAVRAKKSLGGTAPERVDEQIGAVRAGAYELSYKVGNDPPLEAIRARIEAEAL